ncbi:MAG: putative toxin-antitoxin system toxin component, PIN family [Betaproteobacteria bacterium]|nr:putative toxin-antitoxin system toxin component, PIN family [Betaproteobacteria bacterium]
MRVVLDSNVLISALISAGSPPDLIYRAWRKKRFILVTSKTQLAEIRRASRYPKLQKIAPQEIRPNANSDSGILPEDPQDLSETLQ